jgi:hypothetical protein
MASRSTSGFLEALDLVSSRKVGRARECRLGPAQLREAAGWLDDYQRVWGARLDRFADYVEERG